MTMRNRRTILVAFLLLAALLVGVGYAAITGSLTIEGTASNAPQKFNVVFTAAVADTIFDSANDNAVPTLSVQNTKLEVTDPATPITINNLFTVSMTATGLATTEDYVQATFTIKNNNKVAMKLTPTVTGNSIFTVEDGFADGDDEGTAPDATTIIAAEGITTYTVKVYLASDNHDVSKTETFTITLAGVSVV